MMKKFKKTLGTLLILTTLIVGMTGCDATSSDTNSNDLESSSTTVNSDTSSSESNDAPVTDDTSVTEIIYWYAWTDKIQQNNIDLTEEFNETVGKEKGIHVTAEYQGTYDDVHQKLQAAYIAGEAPNVAVMEIASIKTFAMNGVLEPLDPYIKTSNVDMSDFQQGLMQNSYYDDVCYGLPYLRSTPIMYMNTTILKEAGLDTSGPKTWDELAQYARTVKEKTGKYGVAQHSYIWTFEAFMLEHGSSVLNEAETATNMNSDAAKEIINFYKELKADGAGHQFSSGDSDKLKAEVMNQNTAIWFSSTGDLTNNLQIAKDNGFEIETAFIPMAESYGVPTGGCNLIVTNSGTDEEKQAAWEYVNWMTSTEQTIKASENTGYLPTRTSAKDSEKMTALYKEIPQYKVALDQLEYSTGRPMNPGYAEASKAIVVALDAIWINDADVNETLEELEVKVNAVLNE